MSENWQTVIPVLHNHRRAKWQRRSSRQKLRTNCNGKGNGTFGTLFQPMQRTMAEGGRMPQTIGQFTLQRRPERDVGNFGRWGDRQGIVNHEM